MLILNNTEANCHSEKNHSGWNTYTCLNSNAMTNQS